MLLMLKNKYLLRKGISGSHFMEMRQGTVYVSSSSHLLSLECARIMLQLSRGDGCRLLAFLLAILQRPEIAFCRFRELLKIWKH